MRISYLMIAMLSLAIVIRAGVAEAQATASDSKAAAEKREPAPEPVAIENGKVALTPKNTTIQFVGLHTGDKPDPRVGYFSNFKGELAIDEATKAPAAAIVEIETKSLITPFPNLTGHLMSPDFFEVRKYPKATFKSTKIEQVDAATGRYNLTGELTLRDVKKSITFPAEIKISDAGAALASKFKVKRSEFGMTYGLDRVVDEVTMSVTVGKPTPKVEVE